MVPRWGWIIWSTLHNVICGSRINQITARNLAAAVTVPADSCAARTLYLYQICGMTAQLQKLPNNPFIPFILPPTFRYLWCLQMEIHCSRMTKGSPCSIYALQEMSPLYSNCSARMEFDTAASPVTSQCIDGKWLRKELELIPGYMICQPDSSLTELQFLNSWLLSSLFSNYTLLQVYVGSRHLSAAVQRGDVDIVASIL